MTKTTKMTPKQIEAMVAEWREAYAAGTLPKWKIKIMEKIEGWPWGVECGGAQRPSTH